MSTSFTDWIITQLSRWLLREEPPHRAHLCDFDKICKNIQTCDVLLIEGRSHVSTIIRHVTLSPWTHASLCIGHLDDIQDIQSREVAKRYSQSNSNDQLLIESEIGSGTVIVPITKYKDDHVRILRATGLMPKDKQTMINFAISRLGKKYDVQHLLDLARLIFPWGFFPRRWRSSLFQHNALQPTKDICSSMIADAFASIDYPILPLVTEDYKNELELIQRNSRLFTPSDFDYSPYFDVIKYPIFPLAEGSYHNLPWMRDLISDDDGSKFVSLSPDIQNFFKSKAYAVVGASKDRTKFGNKVLRCYLKNNKKVYPVSLHETMIENVPCVKSVTDLPQDVQSISIITQPSVTEKIVEEAIQHGVHHIWMQPGSESETAIQKCLNANINVIAKGPCILQELQFKDD